MMDRAKGRRLYIQIDPTHQHAKIARWVELMLTNEFVLRVQEMHRLLDKHSLQQVTAEFKAKWCLVYGWEVLCQSGWQPTWLDVWSDGFTIRSSIVRAGESKVPRAQPYSVDASYLWGGIDEFVSDFLLESTDEPYDCLETDLAPVFRTP